ncbi:MAG TPA: hypothetical protein VFQ80_07145, partial [Thermomicrobiales bacterium]|nr:hypothetical protein [Thermomicrobiales bacterium]
YDSAAWQPFFTMVGGAAAALVGLLFIALSIQLRAIAADPIARGQARTALGGFVGILALAIVTLIPGQTPRWLGAEIGVIGLALAAASVRFQGETRLRLPPALRPRYLVSLAPVDFATAAILIAAVSLVAGRSGGLYWLAPTVVMCLGNALFNAWSLTVRIGER